MTPGVINGGGSLTRLSWALMAHPALIGGVQVREMWEWRTGGLRYVFDWHREDTFYEFSLQIRKAFLKEKAQ